MIGWELVHVHVLRVAVHPDQHVREGQDAQPGAHYLVGAAGKDRLARASTGKLGEAGVDIGEQGLA